MCHPRLEIPSPPAQTIPAVAKTHRHKQALVFLDWAHAAQEGNYHDNGAHDDKNIAQCQEGQVTEEHSIGVLDQEVDTKAQNATATDLKGRIP